MSIVEKYKAECKDVCFEYIGRGTRAGYSRVQCNTCGTVGEFKQGHIRARKVRCEGCLKTKMIKECSVEGFEWLSKVVKHYSLCRCQECGHEDTFSQSAMRKGKVKCSNCQIIKYKLVVKDGWTFNNHFSKNGKTYVNIKHDCCDDNVKVAVSEYLNGSYDCPHCMHTHFSEQSYFYVIQVGEIIKLGISNRPDKRYTQYGLPDDATIIEHLRISLETKRDALVVESHAKQLVRDFKMPTEISKLVFTKAGFNECYSLESLDLLLTI